MWHGSWRSKNTNEGYQFKIKSSVLQHSLWLQVFVYIIVNQVWWHKLKVAVYKYIRDMLCVISKSGSI